ncbi:MAG: hypothetical protein KAS93_04855 [Gammaproteobacteria bacterium]|nr:hypothetical protein [Gammaproteobacteria bacterium]
MYKYRSPLQLRNLALKFILFISCLTSVTANAKLQLFAQPSSPTRIVNIIKQAHRSIDLEIYLITSHKIINALINAHNRGIRIHVILERQPYGHASNIHARYLLRKAGIPWYDIRWSSPQFTYTHEKAMVMDADTKNAKALIMTFNLTFSAFKYNREYGVIDTNKQDIHEIEKVFYYDWRHHSYPLTGKFNLVWSPINARQKILSLINSAKYSINIEGEELNDQQLINTLNKQAKRGVKIQIVLPITNKAHNLNKHINIHYLNSKKNQLYMHAKMLTVDNSKAYIGSINFSKNSMNNNRELGIILQEPSLTNKANKYFNIDWRTPTKH